MTQLAQDGAARGPVGIGGWLILPLLGLIVTPLRGVSHLAGYIPLLQDTSHLNAAQTSFIYAEFLGNLVILLILPIILLVLLFRKAAAFPKLFSVWAAAALGFIVVDTLIAHVVFGAELAASGQKLLDPETLVEIARSIVLAAIWIPYMRLSKRVANTFIN